MLNWLNNAPSSKRLIPGAGKRKNIEQDDDDDDDVIDDNESNDIGGEEDEPGMVKRKKAAWGSVPNLAGAERGKSFTLWSKDTKFMDPLFKIQPANSKGRFFMLQQPGIEPDSWTLQCWCCKASLEPKLRVYLVNHVKVCITPALERAQCHARDKRNNKLNGTQLKRLAVYSYASCVLDSGTTAGACSPFRELLCAVAPHLEDAIPLIPDTIQRSYMVPVALERVSRVMRKFVGQQLCIALDSTGDPSSHDKDESKLRTLTLAYPSHDGDISKTKSVCLALNGLPSVDNTAAANCSWLVDTISDQCKIIYPLLKEATQQNLREVVAAALDAVASDWGSDNTGQACRAVFVLTFRYTFWFRCLCHLNDTIATPMKTECLFVTELFQLTNTWHNSNDAKLLPDWLEYFGECIRSGNGVQRGTVYPPAKTMEGILLTALSSPPEVNVTRWLPFWKWLKWMHRHFRIFVCYVLAKLRIGGGANATKLYTLVSSSTVELWCSISMMMKLSVGLKDNLKMFQTRQPIVPFIYTIMEGMRSQIGVSKEEVRNNFVLYNGNLQTVRLEDTALKGLMKNVQPTPPQMKKMADDFFDDVATAVLEKYELVWDSYPNKEKEFLRAACMLRPEYRSNMPKWIPLSAEAFKEWIPLSAEAFEEAIQWKEYIDGEGNVKQVEWDKIKEQYATYMIDRGIRKQKINEKETDYISSLWQEQRNQILYPQLAPMMLRILMVVVDSCDPERVFSVYRRVILDQVMRHGMDSDKKTLYVQSKYNAEAGPEECRTWPLSEFKEHYMPLVSIQ